jgi:tRNA_anti-like
MRWSSMSLIVVVLGFTSCNSNDAPKPQIQINDKQNVKNGDAKKAALPKFDLEVPLATLWKEIDEDHKAVGEKYAGKVIAVTGIVGAVSSVNNFTIGEKEMGINCNVSPEYVTIVSYLSRNQKARCIGKVHPMHACLVECAVIELEPSKIEFRTGEEMASAFEKDPKAAASSFKEWNTVVSGTVIEIEDRKFDGKRAFATGTPKTRVAFGVNENGARYLSKGKVAFFRAASVWLDSKNNQLNVNGMALPPR